METIVLASPDPEFRDRLETLVPAPLRKTASILRVDPSVGFLEFLRYEIPDLVVLHGSAGAQGLVSLLEGLEEDPWLASVTMVLVAPEIDETIAACRGYNVAYFLDVQEVGRNLSKVLRLLDENRDVLRYDGLIKKLTVLSGELTLETDLLLVQYYASLFSNYLYKEGWVDRERKFDVRLALGELLTNAMEHGNAGIRFDEKSAWLATGRPIQDLVEERMRTAPWKGRTVSLGFSIAPRSSRFVLTDQGEGFERAPEASSSPGAAAPLAHGRGIALARQAAASVQYNARGNEVVVTFEHNGSAERTIPPGFTQSEPRTFSVGDVVFWENATGDHIYYIVSGEYEVSLGGRKVGRLGPNDVFMGEMSFLLGNRRTATVVAATAGKLVEISREAFTQAVKLYPNYGIFLSKLLARRLRDSNRQFAG